MRALLYRYLKQLINGNYIGLCFDYHISLLTDGGRRGEYSWRYDRTLARGRLPLCSLHPRHSFVLIIARAEIYRFSMLFLKPFLYVLNPS